MTSPIKKSVLITGCSANGIGQAMALSFQAKNYHVFATLRDTNANTHLSSLANTTILALDVTDAASISSCKKIVEEATGGRLDVLINNAGIEFNAPILDTDVEVAKRCFEVNVWGVLRMVQEFAPLLVEARGCVFSQSSIDAELNMAWAGVFASSKAALLRLSETMRVEFEPLGVRVITSICGSVDTPMFAKPGGPMLLPANSYYKGIIETAAWKERMDHQKQATHVNVAAEKLVKAVLEGKKGVLWTAAFSRLVAWAKWLNVLGWVDGLINKSRGVGLVGRGKSDGVKVD